MNVEHPFLLPRGTQLAMTGDDWTPEREKKRQARAEAALRKANQAAIPKLEAAAEALRACWRAYLDAGHPDRMGATDGRLRQADDLMEYASYLRSVVGDR